MQIWFNFNNSFEGWLRCKIEVGEIHKYCNFNCFKHRSWSWIFRYEIWRTWSPPNIKWSNGSIQISTQAKANLFKDYCALGVFSFCFNLNALITMPINSFIVTAILIFLQGKVIHIKYDATAVTPCIVMSYDYLLTKTMPNYVNLSCKKSKISVILIGCVC